MRSVPFPPKQKEVNRKGQPLFVLVRETGLEPVHQRYTPLKRARLPIPPLPRTFDIIAYTYVFVNSFFKKSPRIFIFSRILLFLLKFRLELKIILCVIVCDACYNALKSLIILRIFALVYPLTYQITHNASEVLVASVRNEGAAVGKHTNKCG